MFDTIKDFADKLLADSTPERPAWNKEILLGHISNGWNYVDGCMLKAVLDLYGAASDRKYFDFAENFIDYCVLEDGSIKGYKKEDYNSDHINEGKVLFPLYNATGKEKYKKAIEILISQLQTQPRTPSGNFWHKKIYPNQVWLDGLYMTMPFYAEYETLFNGSGNLRDIIGQFRNVWENMRDEKTGLLYHGRDEALSCAWADKKTGCSPNFWSRSIGWFVMALLDTAEKIDERQFYERELLITYLKDALDALLAVSDPATGMLWQVTNRAGWAGNYLETSASAALAYTLMKSARLGFVPEYYAEKGKRVFNSIVKEKYQKDGDVYRLHDICLVAGLGVYPGRGDYKERDGTYEYYISEPRVSDDAKGVAPFLMAYAEIVRMGKRPRLSP